MFEVFSFISFMEEEKNEPDFKCDIVDCLMEYVDKCQECISRGKCFKHLVLLLRKLMEII